MESASTTETPDPWAQARPRALLFDLAIFLAVMFAVRELYYPPIGFIANGLFWSLCTLVVAYWRMRARGISWADLGLRRPVSVQRSVLATLVIVGLAIGSIVVFQILNDQLPWALAADASEKQALGKFGRLEGNGVLLLSILPFVWLESALEEMLDRGFLMVWIEKVLPGSASATVLAVLLQAAIFGFRHSYDFSERSITVGLIGLAMGVGYVIFGRNLWPLIVAHVALNTLSMVDRVL